jgi:hypothetical protein
VRKELAALLRGVEGEAAEVAGEVRLYLRPAFIIVAISSMALLLCSNQRDWAFWVSSITWFHRANCSSISLRKASVGTAVCCGCEGFFSAMGGSWVELPSPTIGEAPPEIVRFRAGSSRFCCTAT